MGSTTITNYAVQCISSDLAITDARSIYVLWEETFENNCYPRTPRWSSRFVGNYAESVEWILRSAAHCAGGCLKAGNGRDVTPAGYVKQWIKAFKTPLHPDAETACLTLRFGSSFYDIPGRFFELFNETLSGYTRSVTDRTYINLPIGTHAVAERVVSAFRTAGTQSTSDENIYIWQIFSALSGARGAFEHPTPVVDAPDYRVVMLGETPIYDGRFNENLYAFTVHDGSNGWRIDRAVYSAEASVVRSIGSTPGLTLPQSAKILEGVRMAFKNAPQADEAMTYILTVIPIQQGNASEWEARNIREGLDLWNASKSISHDECEDILRRTNNIYGVDSPVVIPLKSIKGIGMAWLCESSLVHHLYIKQELPVIDHAPNLFEQAALF